MTEQDEDREARPAGRWFRSIVVYVDPMLGIVTHGRVPSLQAAKEQFKSSWNKVRAASELGALI